MEHKKIMALICCCVMAAILLEGCQEGETNHTSYTNETIADKIISVTGIHSYTDYYTVTFANHETISVVYDPAKQLGVIGPTPDAAIHWTAGNNEHVLPWSDQI